MKSLHGTSLAGGLLLAGLLFCSWSSFARPPQSYSKDGVIQSIDQTTRSFTINSGKNSPTQSFVWNNGTSFRQKSAKPDASWFSLMFTRGERISSNALLPGGRVYFYYRRESGRLVVRALTVVVPIKNHCDCCCGTSTGKAEHSAGQQIVCDRVILPGAVY